MAAKSRSSPAGLELVSVEDEAFAELRYLNAARGGGTVSERLPVQRGLVRGLPRGPGGLGGPGGLDALIATSDLQGVVRARRGAPSTLLGIAVAELLEELSFDGAIPPAERTGVLLAGDLYSVPDADKRGGHGDVAAVWAAFAERFAWVAGVAGNHDDVSRLVSDERVHLLDTDVVDKGGLRLGGVGYIAGNPEKRGRRAEDDQLERLELIAMEGVDILLCHEGPSGEGASQLGHEGIRALVERSRVPLTICGHVHWGDAVARHPRGAILNVDARVVVLTAAEAPARPSAPSA